MAQPVKSIGEQCCILALSSTGEWERCTNHAVTDCEDKTHTHKWRHEASTKICKKHIAGYCLARESFMTPEGHLHIGVICGKKVCVSCGKVSQKCYNCLHNRNVKYNDYAHTQRVHENYSHVGFNP